MQQPAANWKLPDAQRLGAMRVVEATTLESFFDMTGLWCDWSILGMRWDAYKRLGVCFIYLFIYLWCTIH